jgi:peptidyl-prolyl cis-trans isomerase SurA
MNKSGIIILLITILFGAGLKAQKQDDRILLTINDKPVTVSEFLYVYNKNNRNKEYDSAAIHSYLDLYIKFRMKVMEAEARGMDTLESFKRELRGYRNQLARPYLTDKDVNEKLLKEAYERLQWDIRASHIMKMIPETVDNDDSIAKAAYKELMDIRKRAIAGEDFAELAKKYSDDPSARDKPATKYEPARKGNGGDLGYFTAFYMVYPFENAAYNTPVGDISMPVRTKYGYHLVKVTDRIPALGTIHVAHIVINTNNDMKLADADAKKKIEEIKKEILDGKVTFEEAAAKYSDDAGTADKGGVLNWFEVSKMVPQFIKAISDIDSIGGISYPVKTEYGWHIIKLLQLNKVPPYEEYLPELKAKVERDSRSNKSREAAADKFKAEYGFKEYPKALQKFYSVVDSSIFTHSWKAEKAKGLKKKMFVLDGKPYTQADFAKFVEDNQRMIGKGTIKYVVHKLYDQWVYNTVMAYKDSKLEDEYFDFKMLVQEYHDGILLFNISDEMVWGKAIRDTNGLKEFYEENKDKYMWGERIDAEIFKAKNDSLADVLIAYLNKGLEYDSIIKLMNKKSKLNIGYERGKYEKGTNKIIDKVAPKEGISQKVKADNSVYVVKINAILKPANKKISEARGLITADYQNYLQDKWIKELKSKYKVTVNEEVVKSIEKE